MSEHTPITGELREAVEWEPTFCGPDKAMVQQPEFDRICDAIDAVHAGLERENAELRAKLDNIGESMHDGGRITDELREWYKDRMFMGNGWQELDNIADRIDAEHEKQVTDAFTKGAIDGIDMAEHSIEYVKLPVDADGVSIHAGDVLDGYGKTIEVVEMRYGRSGWVLISRDGNGYADCAAFVHHHAPTVEDVLREFANEVYADADNEIRDRDFLCAKYAKRLTLAGDAE